MRVTAWQLVTVWVAPDCDAKPPLLHVTSWHVQGQLYLYQCYLNLTVLTA